MDCRWYVDVFYVLLIAVAVLLQSADAQNGATDEPFDFEKASRDVLKPREIWPLLQDDIVPLDLKIVSDEIVPSDSVPGRNLRKVTAHFNSIKLEGKVWGHDCVLLVPEDVAADHKTKVAIIGSPPGDYYPVHVAKYGEPIASRLGYPAMVVDNPGTYEDGYPIEHDIGVLGRTVKATGKFYYNMNCQLAIVYIKAMDACRQILGVDKVQAIVGGHSKRGRSATVAAAMDDRVASVIIMGNEGIYPTDRIVKELSFHHAFFQDEVHVPVFYIGATNEDGYKMFNVNIMQERLRDPMTIEYIPNYVHSNFSEIQYMDWLMWVAHIYDGRPITKISDVTWERLEDRTIFRAGIESDARIQTAKVWYVYTDDPAWRDLMWYHLLMPKKGDHYEAVLFGKIPDAFLVEVGDIAQGVPGYVSSVPYKLTDAPVEERKSRGSFPRSWEPPPAKQ